MPATQTVGASRTGARFMLLDALDRVSPMHARDTQDRNCTGVIDEAAQQLTESSATISGTQVDRKGANTSNLLDA